MKFNKLIFSLALLISVFALTACNDDVTSENAKGDKDKEIVLKFHHVLAPSYPYQL